MVGATVGHRSGVGGWLSEAILGKPAVQKVPGIRLSPSTVVFFSFGASCTCVLSMCAFSWDHDSCRTGVQVAHTAPLKRWFSHFIPEDGRLLRGQSSPVQSHGLVREREDDPVHQLQRLRCAHAPPPAPLLLLHLSLTPECRDLHGFLGIEMPSMCPINPWKMHRLVGLHLSSWSETSKKVVADHPVIGLDDTFFSLQ